VGTELTLTAVAGIPPVKPGDDIADLILRQLDQTGIGLVAGDVLVIAQKIISKAEGQLVQLAAVTPGERARQIAQATDKDPRLVELILRESDEISRMSPGVLIVRHRLGFTSANAGIDRSNVGQDGPDETVLLLPHDPDASAVQIRQTIEDRCDVSIGVVISDSHGRPFRLGTVGMAIGVSGIPALWDRRGEADLHGYTLQHTDVGIGDEIAAAAGLLMGQGAEGLPVVLVRGLTLPEENGRATDLVRPKEKDLYR
jgi:coenzyme F420-0:L-glutamate ligase/coenzyme F420-1:gamma-L-glutamate ligase